jgi:hypothetical protein
VGKILNPGEWRGAVKSLERSGKDQALHEREYLRYKRFCYTMFINRIKHLQEVVNV